MTATTEASAPPSPPSPRRRQPDSANDAAASRGDAREVAALLMLRQAVLRYTRRRFLAKQNFQGFVAAAASLIFWTALLGGFYEGFGFLSRAVPGETTQLVLIESMFNVFFLTLLGMMTLSSAVMLYVSLFRDREVTFLLTRPVRERRIAGRKLHNVALFAGWGFFVLATPLLLSYGIVYRAPWSFYLEVPFALAAFSLFCASLGGLLCLAVAQFLGPIRLGRVLIGMGVILGLALVAGVIGLVTTGPPNLDAASLAGRLSRLVIIRQRFLPSWWMSTYLLESVPLTEVGPDPQTDGWDWPSDRLMFLALMITTALVTRFAFGALAAMTLRSSYHRIHITGSRRANASRPTSPSEPSWLTRLFRRPTAAMIAKDLRVFRRDPVQWIQLIIVGGLMGLYFISMQRFNPEGYWERWKTILGFLSLAVIGLILSAFTTRFVFPLLSLEGRSLWILGTLPIRRRSVMMAKWIFAVGILLPPALLISFVGDLVLGAVVTTPGVMLIRLMTCAAMTVGLCSLAVGLGARFPDLDEPSPAKIANGFGGTVNLIASALFVGVLLSVVSVPTALWIEADELTRLESAWNPPWYIAIVGLGTVRAVVLGCAMAAIVTAIATIVPMRIGIRAFERLET